MKHESADDIWTEFLRKNAESTNVMVITFGIAMLVLAVAGIMYHFAG